MQIGIVTPASPGSRKGNRVTALRWAAVLRRLGHGVWIEHGAGVPPRPCDVLVALHARRSHDAVEAFATRCPGHPVVVALTGTDLYIDLPAGGDPAHRVLATLSRADAVVALHPKAGDALPAALRHKLRIIVQSARAPARRTRLTSGCQVLVIGHLRRVKAPEVPAAAAARLPADTAVSIFHIGQALDDELWRWAVAQSSQNPAWTWLGPRSRQRTLELLAGSDGLIVPSRAEGGANVVTEAIACGIPVIASAVAGNTGLLGADYPGTVAPDDPAALADRLDRLATDARFADRLRAAMVRLAPMVDPAVERAAWARTLAAVEGPRP